MVFEAMIYHIDETLIFRLLSSDLDYSSYQEKTYYDEHGFAIHRRGTFVLQQDVLFLPGTMDHDKPFPRSDLQYFRTKEELNDFLRRFKTAYKAVNGCEPLIIDLDFKMDLEDAPDFKVGSL